MASIANFLPEPAHPKVVAYLSEHGFTEKNATRFGWYEAEAARGGQLLGLHPALIAGADVCLVQPNFTRDGTPDREYHRAIFFPTAERFADGARYRKLGPSAKRAANRVMFLPDVDYSGEELILTESLPKAAFLFLRTGRPAAGAQGVDGWSANDFLGGPWKRIIFLTDSVKEKSRRNLENAVQRLAAALPDVDVRWSKPQEPPQDWIEAHAGKTDWGVDDSVLYADDEGHGAWVLDQMLRSARPVNRAEEIGEYIERLSPDFHISPPPEPLAVVPGLLPCRNGVLFAPGGERKSTFTVYLAAQVALGRPVFGRRVERPGRVLYVTGEDERDDVERTLALMIQSGAIQLTPQEAAQLRDRLPIVPTTKLPGFPRLTRKADGSWGTGDLLPIVERALQHLGNVSLLVLDTLSTLGLSETEGMNDAAAAYQREAHRIARQHSVCLLALHHVGKAFAQERSVDMYGARGASAITDNSRFALQLQFDRGESEFNAPPAISQPEREGKVEGVSVLRLHVHKMRWSPINWSPSRPLWVRSTGWHYETFDALGHAASVQQSAARQIQHGNARRDAAKISLVEALLREEREGRDVKERQLRILTMPLSDGKPFSRTEREAAAADCEAEGLVEIVELPGRGKPKQYHVTEKGRRKF